MLNNLLCLLQLDLLNLIIGAVLLESHVLPIQISRNTLRPLWLINRLDGLLHKVVVKLWCVSESGKIFNDRVINSCGIIVTVVVEACSHFLP